MSSHTYSKDHTDAMVLAPFDEEAILDDGVHMSEEAFAEFKANIKSEGMREKIEVWWREKDNVMVKTIVDGYHRYHVMKQLGKSDSEIDFILLPLASLQEACEYQFKVNNLRKSYNTYTRVTRGIEVYGQNYLGKELSAKVGVSAQTISKIKILNTILASGDNSEIASKFKEDCVEGNKWADSLRVLQAAQNIDNIIAVIDNPNGEVAKKIGKNKAKLLKEKLQSNYIEKKYDSKGKALKQLNTEIDKVVHPECYRPVEESPYAIAAQKVSDKINPLAEKFPNEVKVFMVDTEESFLETGDFIKSNAGRGELYAIVVMLKLPKELVDERKAIEKEKAIEHETVTSALIEEEKEESKRVHEAHLKEAQAYYNALTESPIYTQEQVKEEFLNVYTIEDWRVVTGEVTVP